MADERPDDERTEDLREAESWDADPVEDPEAPEADAQEQQRPVTPVSRPRPATEDLEAPEADAIEQSITVEGDDDEYGAGPAEEL